DLVDSNGSFLWLHHPQHEEKIDIGALPIPNELGIDDIDITTAIHEIDPHENWLTEVGEQLFVVGFPFGLSDTCNLPIWKAATLASEPEIDQEGLPLLYIDTATRKGMSGSPVIKYRRRSVSLITEESLCRFHAEFIGVYSGRIVPKDMFEAQIGKVWRAKCIDEIIKGGHFYSE
ncbi:hypothetical protein, partial [Okeania sp. SIO2G5]|uniref:hypothetical protein n=1 Tax=Okeania sp. SIO2G5 TaxID=2607796 RepID=UPI0013C0334E